MPGSETRVKILQALAENPEETVSVSEFRERDGMRDSGKFNYHLETLTGHFVRHTDAGYTLSIAGVTVVGALVARCPISRVPVSTQLTHAVLVLTPARDPDPSDPSQRRPVTFIRPSGLLPSMQSAPTWRWRTQFPGADSVDDPANAA